jgi:predicted MFS family arabinose efflux permease
VKPRRLLLEALRFQNPHQEALRRLSTAEWRRLLKSADEERLTLALGLRCGPVLPEPVRVRIDADLAKNTKRFAKAQEDYEEIAAALRACGVEFVVLKGFSHWPSFSLDPRHRPQYDLDLLCPPDQVFQARDALVSLGYEPVAGFDNVPLDHLPSMVPKTRWQWRGDYFDIDIPFAVELHFRLWDAATEHIPIPGLQVFWDRRTISRIDCFDFNALDEVDRVAYAALHLLRHLLRGDVRLYHAYELAHFLNQTADDRAFWQRWLSTHEEPLRAIQAISFRLAGQWFDCRIPTELVEEFDRAVEPVQRWFHLFALAPVESKAHPNKNELWLHLSLIHSTAQRRSVMLRRLFPAFRYRTMQAHQIPKSQAMWVQIRFMLMRFSHHFRSAFPTLSGGLRWWWAAKGIDPQFLRFLAAASLFNFGMAIFFLLYNLFLLQRGFEEDFLGGLSSAMSVGSIAGTLPAAYVLHNFGIRTTLVVTLFSLAVVSAFRALAEVPSLLIVSAFAGGFLFSFYAVSIAPTVAQLTTDRARPFGFSLFFSLGIAIGVLAGLIGGRLPTWMAEAFGPGAIPLRSALLVACGIAALGAVPALRLRFRSKPESETRVYPRSRFIKQFLLVLLLWNLATGAFNPFFTVYFSKTLGMPLSQIGAVFSAAQLVQVVALLAAPVVLRRIGAIRGLMSMQIATGLALAALAIGPTGVFAGALYAAYMGFQYMSEPGMYSLLMERVKPQEQSGASALNFLVIFGGQALAASIAGLAVRWFGYPIVLSAAAVAAVLAAIAVRQIRSSTAATSFRNLSSVNLDR